MCHLILLLPIFGLAVFWIWPLSVAAPIYGVLVLFSAFFYFAIMRAMRRSVQTGHKGLIHQKAHVVEALNPEGRVRVHGELWKAVSLGRLNKGEQAEVISVEGLTLNVQKWVQDRQGNKSENHNKFQEKYG